MTEMNTAVPEWLTRITRPANTDVAGRDIGAIIAGGAQYASDRINKQPEPKPEDFSSDADYQAAKTAAQPKSFMQDVYEGRMNQKDPFWKLKASQAVAQTAALTAETESRTLQNEQSARQAQLTVGEQKAFSDLTQKIQTLPSYTDKLNELEKFNPVTPQAVQAKTALHANLISQSEMNGELSTASYGTKVFEQTFNRATPDEIANITSIRDQWKAKKISDGDYLNQLGAVNAAQVERLRKEKVSEINMRGAFHMDAIAYRANPALYPFYQKYDEAMKSGDQDAIDSATSDYMGAIQKYEATKKASMARFDVPESTKLQYNELSKQVQEVTSTRDKSLQSIDAAVRSGKWDTKKSGDPEVERQSVKGAAARQLRLLLQQQHSLITPVAPEAANSGGPSDNDIQFLKENPDKRAGFDHKFGAGASDKYLTQ